jgi:hypothetical protein
MPQCCKTLLAGSNAEQKSDRQAKRLNDEINVSGDVSQNDKFRAIKLLSTPTKLAGNHVDQIANLRNTAFG